MRKKQVYIVERLLVVQCCRGKHVFYQTAAVNSRVKIAKTEKRLFTTTISVNRIPTPTPRYTIRATTIPFTILSRAFYVVLPTMCVAHDDHE